MTRLDNFLDLQLALSKIACRRPDRLSLRSTENRFTDLERFKFLAVRSRIRRLFQDREGIERLKDMWKLPVPDEVLDKLRCSFCKEYLSHLPVYIYPGQEGIACGRCPLLFEQNPVRDVSYEALACYLHFPCRYKAYGCLETMILNRVQSHEDACTFKQYYCPFIPLASCPWQGPADELFFHYRDHHEELALSSPTFEIDLINMYEHNYLLYQETELFIIHVKFDILEEVFWCSVRYIGNHKMANRFHYGVEIKKNNSIECITLSKKVVENDMSMHLDKLTAINVQSSEIRNALGNPCSILCSIYILPNELINIDTTDLKDEIKNETSISAVDSDILLELECPVCNEYMVPPIYQCVVGHSICSTCKPLMNECPTCRDKIAATRNFSLEKLTRIIKYNCKYKDLDCPFQSNSEEIKDHEAKCKFGPYNCPFDEFRECKWKGKLSDIIYHAKTFHEDDILEVNYLTWAYLDASSEDIDEDCYLIKSFGSLFRIIFKFCSKMFYWSIQYVGPPEEAEKFMYELDIGDNSGLNQRLYIKRKCCALLSYKNSCTDPLTCVQIPFDLIKPLLNQEDMVYKIRVVKD
ncbi:hypothetical protein FQA39_LY00714 [Lamprigera yunnana]|nr:hypothetical protein FQA39_LY00714 [Lamprigera yunnana]